MRALTHNDAAHNVKQALKRRLKEGLFDQNPVFVQLLGTCPTLAVTTTVANGFGMGLSVLIVLVMSNLLISLLRKFIPEQIRIASYIVIISGFVTAVELLIKAYVPALDASLGLFIPLIVVNCIILARAEAYASKHGPVNAVLDGVFMGLGFTFALCLLGAVREVLGSGTLFGFPVLWGGYRPMLVFVMPAGAFLTLGVLIAAVNAVKNALANRRAAREEEADL